MIQESIDELIEKGKKRTLNYEELLARRKSRQKKMMQLDEAKSYLLLYFARAFAVNREISNTLTKALVLSLIPRDYKYLTYPVATLRFTDYLTKVLT